MIHFAQEIKYCIEEQLKNEKRKFIIFPYGDVGLQVKQILNECYNINECYIIDNNLCKYNEKIKKISFLNTLDCSNYVIILATTNERSYCELKKKLLVYFKENNIAELPSMKKLWNESQLLKKCGKYSYGPLCNHRLVESIGSFCSFALGTDVVENHPIQYISTHPFMYHSVKSNDNNCENEVWRFSGIIPKGKVGKYRKITIGNDVWLGKNVIITNGSNIGNGVIAGAGAVITKDVPDYAVVCGVPAKIIRYRYTPDQIESLNKIAWWDWTDDEIRERYDDFFLPINEFIDKYIN